MLFCLLLAAEWVPSADPLPPPAAGWGAFVEDVNGDGVPELGSVSHGTVPVWVEARDGLTPLAHPFGEKERDDRHAMVPCDIDGDGLDEVVVAMGGGKGTKSNLSFILWSEGDGWRVEPLDATAGLRGRGLSCVDLDGDDQPELYFPGHGAKTADMLLVHEGEAWVDRAAEWGLQRMGNTFGGLWEDLDGDGDLDLVRLEDGQVVLLLQSEGVFAPAPVQPDNKAVRDIAMGDVDNDGDMDLYFARGGFFDDAVGDQGARLHLRKDTTDTVTWQYPDTCKQAFIRAQGDFSGKQARMRVADGRAQQQFALNFNEKFADIPEGEGLLLWLDPDLRTVHVMGMGLQGRVTLTLDCSRGEGEPTLLLADVKTRKVTEKQDMLWLNDGSGQFTAGTLPPMEDVGTGHAQFVDVDLDGDLDLFLVTEATPGTLNNAPDVLLLNDNGTFYGAPNWVNPDREPIVEGQFGVAVDLDGDRYPELLAFNGAYPRNQAGRTALWANPGGDNGWVSVSATRDGADSLGARITVEAGGVTQTRLANPHPDFRSNGSQALVFGIGEAQSAKVTVTYPDGRTKVVRRVKPNTDVVVDR